MSTYLNRRRLWQGLVLLLLPLTASAASLNGATLSPLWALPFAGILLSIAIVPLIAPHAWHRHFGKISAAWALAFLVPFAVGFGAQVAFATFVHAMLEEYVPFIILLTALFTVAGARLPRFKLLERRRLRSRVTENRGESPGNNGLRGGVDTSEGIKCSASESSKSRAAAENSLLLVAVAR